MFNFFFLFYLFCTCHCTCGKVNHCYSSSFFLSWSSTICFSFGGLYIKRLCLIYSFLYMSTHLALTCHTRTNKTLFFVLTNILFCLYTNLVQSVLHLKKTLLFFDKWKGIIMKITFYCIIINNKNKTFYFVKVVVYKMGRNSCWKINGYGFLG